MSRLLLSCLAVACGLLCSGCGGSGGSSTSAKTPAATSVTASPTPATTTAPAVSPETQAGMDVAFAKNRVDALRYCVHVLGARIGRQKPPTAAQRHAKDLLIKNAGYVLRDAPNVTVRGQSLSVFFSQMARQLRVGDCDTKGASKLEALARKARSSGY